MSTVLVFLLSTPITSANAALPLCILFTQLLMNFQVIIDSRLLGNSAAKLLLLWKLTIVLCQCFLFLTLLLIIYLRNMPFLLRVLQQSWELFGKLFVSMPFRLLHNVQKWTRGLCWAPRGLLWRAAGIWGVTPENPWQHLLEDLSPLIAPGRLLQPALHYPAVCLPAFQREEQGYNVPCAYCWDHTIKGVLLAEEGLGMPNISILRSNIWSAPHIQYFPSTVLCSEGQFPCPVVGPGYSYTLTSLWQDQLRSHTKSTARLGLAPPANVAKRIFLVADSWLWPARLLSQSIKRY